MIYKNEILKVKIISTIFVNDYILHIFFFFLLYWIPFGFGPTLFNKIGLSNNEINNYDIIQNDN